MSLLRQNKSQLKELRACIILKPDQALSNVRNGSKLEDKTDVLTILHILDLGFHLEYGVRVMAMATIIDFRDAAGGTRWASKEVPTGWSRT
ncbi:hypothetical protein IFR05_007161 [Cadophora sp. M221]|nr:hypothetical protein IFR05_007161 [Cadophora sp. M221]